MIHNIANQPYMQTAAIHIDPLQPTDNQVAHTIPQTEKTEDAVHPLTEQPLPPPAQILQTQQQNLDNKLHQLEHQQTEAMQKKLDAERAQLRFEAARDDAVKIINSYLVKAGCQVIPEPGSAAWHQAVVGEKKKLFCFYNSDANKKNCYDKLKLHYDTYYQTWHQALVKARKEKEHAEQIYHTTAQQIATIKHKMAADATQRQPLQVQPTLPTILVTDSDATENSDMGNRLLTPTQATKFFDVYMHHTDEANLDSIHKTGLYPAGPSGHQTGIGDENGECCTDGVYVVQPGKMIYDPRPGIALVVSVEAPQPDVNYHKGEAGIFYPKNDTNNLPPVREAQTEHSQATYSLTLPITPETQSGLRRFLQPNSLSAPQDASHLVLEKFKENFPIWGLDKDLCKIVPAEHTHKDGVAQADENSVTHIDDNCLFDYDSL